MAWRMLEVFGCRPRGSPLLLLQMQGGTLLQQGLPEVSLRVDSVGAGVGVIGLTLACPLFLASFQGSLENPQEAMQGSSFVELQPALFFLVERR